MARPSKLTVDYFPHVTQTGKTIAILERRWGNDGYAFWFKLLELLGTTRGFCYDCGNAANWEYLLSKTGVEEPTASAILDKLAELKAIDAGLWQERKIWSDNFVAGVADAFSKRQSALPRRPLTQAEMRRREESTPEFTAPETGKGEGEEMRSENEIIPENEIQKGEGNPSLRQGTIPLADTVFLTPEEIGRLRGEYGEAGLERMVEILDAYKTNHPDRGALYRNDYKVILSWVIRRYQQEQAEDQGKRQEAENSDGRAGRRSMSFNDKLADMLRGVEQ